MVEKMFIQVRKKRVCMVDWESSERGNDLQMVAMAKVNERPLSQEPRRNWILGSSIAYRLLSNRYYVILTNL